MRRHLSSLLVLTTLLAVAAAPVDSRDSPKDDPKADKAKSKKPADLPGPFHPYNITGPRKGNFHCLVSEYGQNPAVMIVVRGTEVSDTLKSLLQKLERTIDRNPTLRLGVFAVFVPDDLKDVVVEDDKREQLAAKVKDAADGDMLKHVVLCLDGKSDLEKFKLEEDAVVTVLLYRRYKVLASSTALEKDQLTEDKVKEIMAAVADKLGAKRQ